MRKLMRESARGLLAIGMGVQCILGLVWISLNFTHFQNLQRTADYVRAGQDFVVDEYMGIMYPILVAGAGALERMTGIPFYCFLYLLQLTAAFAAGCFFFWLLGHGKRKVFSLSNIAGSLFLLTIPMVLQCHLAVLPQSLVCSAFLVLLGLCYHVLAGKRKPDLNLFLLLCGLWGSMSLLLPDYLWLGGVPVVCMGVICIIRHESWKQALSLIMVTAVVICCIGRVAVTPGSYGRIQRTMGAAMVSRVVWPNFSTTYFFWPQEVKDIMSEHQGEVISVQSDRVQTVFGPMMETAFGKETADQYYWQMALQCFQVRTKEIVGTIWQDFVAYLCVPLSLKCQLDGSGLSFSGWNYGQMREQAPVLTRYYVHYSLWMFRIGLLIAGFTAAAGFMKGKREKRREKGLRCRLLLLVSWLVVPVVWYTMSGAGMMDYLNVTPVAVLWYICLPAAFAALGKPVQGTEQRKEEI